MANERTRHVDGSPLLTLKLEWPQWSFGLVLIGLLSYTIKARLGGTDTKGMESILTTMTVGYFAVFYARRSIIASRERDQRSRTIDFSIRFSEDPIRKARDEVKAQMNRISTTFLRNERTAPNDFHSMVVQEFSALLQDARMHYGLEMDQIEPDLLSTRYEYPRHNSNDELVTHVLLILDYFEDLAVGIENGVFDREMAKDLLRGGALNYWRIFSRFIENERDQNESSYVKFEELRKSWA